MIRNTIKTAAKDFEPLDWFLLGMVAGMILLLVFQQIFPPSPPVGGPVLG
jgi:hypothetical protein